VDALPQIGLGTAVLIIFASLVAFMVIRGVLRMLWGVTQLILAGLAAWWVWNHGPPAGVADWTAQFDLPLAAVCAAAFVATLLACQLAAILLRRLFRPPFEEDPPPPAFSLGASLLLCLAATLILCIGGAFALHHFGSMAEARAHIEESTPGWLVEWKQRLESAIPDAWSENAANENRQARLDLLKQMCESLQGTLKGPEAEAFRAWLADHPDFKHLLDHRRYAEALRDPRLDSLIQDPAAPEKLAKPEL
jgi:hypothetical protein